MKNSNDTIWNRTSDLPIVAQHLNHCATAALRWYEKVTYKTRLYLDKTFSRFVSANFSVLKLFIYLQMNAALGRLWDKIIELIFENYGVKIGLG